MRLWLLKYIVMVFNNSGHHPAVKWRTAGLWTHSADESCVHRLFLLPHVFIVRCGLYARSLSLWLIEIKTGTWRCIRDMAVTLTSFSQVCAESAGFRSNDSKWGHQVSDGRAGLTSPGVFLTSSGVKQPSALTSECFKEEAVVTFY